MKRWLWLLLVSSFAWSQSANGPAYLAGFAALGPQTAGVILGAPCASSTCTAGALSTTDFLFNPSNDTLTLGGTGVLTNNTFAVIQPQATSGFTQALGIDIKGGQNTGSTAAYRGGGVIVEGGLYNTASAGGSTGALTFRTGSTDIGVAANVGNTGLGKFYTGDTNTAGATSGIIKIGTGAAPAGSGTILLATGVNTGTSGTTGSGGITFQTGVVNSGATGGAGNYTFTLPTDANTAVNSSHSSVLVVGGSLMSGLASAQDWFTNGAMVGGIVLQPNISSTTPSTADPQVVIVNGNNTGGVSVDYQGKLQLYSGIVDVHTEATYTTAITGTNCTSIANQQGGPTAGSFTVTATAGSTCTITITIGQAAGIPLSATDWVCGGSESTAGTGMFQADTAASTTSCKIKGVIAASGDLVKWWARGFK